MRAPIVASLCLSLIGCPVGMQPIDDHSNATAKDSRPAAEQVQDLPQDEGPAIDEGPALDIAVDAVSPDQSVTHDRSTPPPDTNPPADLKVDPCEGVVCDSPPATTCINNVRTTYGSGSCTNNGKCSYQPSTYTCPAGCETATQCACVTEMVSGYCKADAFWSLLAMGHCQYPLHYTSHDFDGIPSCSGDDAGMAAHQSANITCCP